ncbi:D-alanyl-D-alanine carboxypeptidase [Pleurocapsa sp. CCALA 161]|uniref:M15 family metallopeptidase n=1 Tax=Pleurocapsa sp. CCALA 161 TaxID=2107688 RepID=UPI000D058CFF|nr:M15 family metallopeptidase [Pleurocapsa sp. CCALA 161]PSB12329.1 D-alanyl-D-alanine carboxypeptidase [Pleurocapsa sp. CCALA 161]
MEEFEIPEAIREHREIPKKSGLPLPLLAVGVVLLGIIGFIFVRIFLPASQPTPTVVDAPTAEPLPQTKPKPKPKPTPAPNKEQGNLLGHLPYDVASESALVPVMANSSLKMRPAAASKFRAMQAAAKADGVSLTLISAFRDLKTQEQLFFGVKEQRIQDATKRAEVSAPPGYSEHHTGYAIDLGDGNAPATNLEKDFAKTAAFGWLQQNALKYSFEMSFPPDNIQGVSYEPWHWRFVGDRDSLETFYKVRN